VFIFLHVFAFMDD